MQPLIVVVEDDPVISELIVYNLASEGYRTRAFSNGRSMFDARGDISDAVLFILDIMLPGMDGIEICKNIRTTTVFENVPVIMLTARNNEMDKVNALDIGADDYITKPFGVREFLSRVKAHIRRYLKEGPISEESTRTDTISSSDIYIDDTRHRVFRNGQEIMMTNREYELLKFMMRNKGIAYSRDDLLLNVWGYDYAGETRTVDVHIRQLRKKIGDKKDEMPVIETVRGRGYRFNDQEI